MNTKASIGPSGSSEHKDDLNNLQRSLFFALCIPPGNTHTHKPLLQFPGRIIYADCKVVQLLWCCTEQNSRCVLYNRSRGKEGRKSRRGLPSKLPLFPFARLHFYLFKSVSSNWKPVCFFLSLPSLFSTFYAFLHFTLSLSFFFPSLLNPRRLRCCLRENVGHLFSAIPLTPTRRRRWKW